MNTNGRIVIDSKDMAVEKYPWGELRWLWNSKINQHAQQTFGIVLINPGKKNTTHIHPNCEEVLYVLSGECEHKVGDEIYHLKQGMIIAIPAGAAHCAVNNGNETFEAALCYSSPERQMRGTEA